MEAVLVPARSNLFTFRAMMVSLALMGTTITIAAEGKIQLPNPGVAGQFSDKDTIEIPEGEPATPVVQEAGRP